MKKRILAAVLAVIMVVLTVGLASCGKKSSDSTSDKTTSTKEKLVLGFDSEFPPMGFLDDETNEYTGFDIDLAKEAAKRLGYELELKPINWDTKDTELSSGSIDMIWNGFTMHVTEDDGSNRDDNYTWTEAYMKNAQVIVVNNNNKTITSVADLKGKTVETQKASSGLSALNDNKTIKSSVKEIVQTKDYETALNDLETGACDAVVMDETVIGYKISQGRSFKIVGESLADEEYGVAFLKGNTKLRDKIQGALEDMAADGTLAKISKQWFSKDVTTIGK